ncbi:aldehyde dehydrogenase family protein [Actinoplanes solisilvae]|uniref:aldehyde dehydrogenase family protein n=1 Tax=Actinoplanes solisilvae TaxID=2486853 RepID=UPI00196AF6CA|nr:aldehyde dehydrogenase family protein [Actinoplanes solisilvae]
MDLRMFVGGAWTTARSKATVTATSPATGDNLGQIPVGGREDAQAAVDAARAIAPRWAGLGAFTRAKLLHRVADTIERRRDSLAKILTMDQGKPLFAEAYDEVDELIEYWRMAAEDGKRLSGQLPSSVAANKRAMLIRRPRGVVGVITPWNWPYTMPAELIAPALAAGNTVVWTPAPTTSVAAIALADCVADADLPGGVLNLVLGPGPVVGDEIARNPGVDAVAFIGSTATGRKVASAAAGKATLLEMGGNGPLVVLDDADLDQAVQGALLACFLCAGQSCTAGERLLVHAAVHDEFARRLAEATRDTVALGDPFGDGTTMGPLNNAAVAAKMDAHVADAVARGATILTGGERAKGHLTDLYWQPTVLDNVPRHALVATEETFGPVAPIVTIRSLDEAIELTNASRYGLLAAIYTADVGKGLAYADAVRTGWVNVNASTNYWESHLPFGGRSGSDSGLGRVGGSHAMETFTELQTVILG